MGSSSNYRACIHQGSSDAWETVPFAHEPNPPASNASVYPLKGMKSGEVVLRWNS